MKSIASFLVLVASAAAAAEEDPSCQRLGPNYFACSKAAGGCRARLDEAFVKLKESAFELKFAFAAWSVGDEALTRLGFDPAKAKADPKFNLLKKLGMTERHIEELNRVICGTQTVEGAPALVHGGPAHGTRRRATR